MAVSFVGWTAIVGGTPTLSVAVALLTEPMALATLTLYLAPFTTLVTISTLLVAHGHVRTAS